MVWGCNIGKYFTLNILVSCPELVTCHVTGTPRHVSQARLERRMIREREADVTWDV